MEVDDLLQAVREAVDERLEPIEARLDALEASNKTNADAFADLKEGINKTVGASKSVVGSDEGVTEPSTKSTVGRDAWGRRIKS